MGLDWVAMEQVGGEWRGVSMYRGKGVAYDKNIETLDYDNECYGIEEHTHKDISGLPYMPRNVKWELYTIINALLKVPEDELELEGWDSYEEWRDFMEGAKEFLKHHERIFCWY